MAEMKPKRFTIGYALLLKKQQSFIQDSLINLSKSRGIDLIKIDTEKPLLGQGPFDCVLHKLSGSEWKNQIRDYLVHNPTSVVIDSPESIERLHNRVSMLDVVSEIQTLKNNNNNNTETEKTASFGVPKQVVIYEPGLVQEPGLKLKLKFPVIAKPLVADGSLKSHKMLLIFSPEGFENLKTPTVLQEFVNHGGVIFKVYVVGEYVKCVKRKSLPDVDEAKMQGLKGSMSFSQVSNLTSKDAEVIDSEDAEMEMEMPPVGLVNDIARGLRKAMRLNLFNFDVIRDTKVGNRYLVIDINYFPGYAKMPGYESVLTDFFWDVLNKKDARFFDIEKDDTGSGCNVSSA